MPLASSFRALSRASRASLSEMVGYRPNASSLCRPPNRYAMRQSLDPFGCTNRRRPPPSLFLYGVASGFAVRHSVSVSFDFIWRPYSVRRYPHGTHICTHKVHGGPRIGANIREGKCTQKPLIYKAK